MMEYCLIYVQTAFYTHGNVLDFFRQFFPAYLAQSVLLYFFAGRLFTKRKSYKFILVNICAVAEAAGISFALSLLLDHWAAYLLVFVIAMTWRTFALHFFYSDKFNRKTAYVLLTQAVLTLSDPLAGMICYTIDGGKYFRFGYVHRWDAEGMYRIFFCTCLKIGELVLLLLLCRQLTRFIIAGSKKEWDALNYFAVILCAASLLTSLLFYDYPMTVVYLMPPFAAMLLAAVLAGIIVLLRFFPKICGLFQRGDNEFILRYAGGPSGYRGENASSVQQLRKLRHDVKNNIVTITALIDSGESAEAKRLLGELGERITSALGSEPATGVAAIDTTLSAKAALCGERGVTLDMHVEPLPETKILPIDLSSAISNILDNAIEAAEQCPEPVITLRIFKYKMYLAIVCENPVSALPQTVDGRLVTTKENGGQHGCGTEIVSEICRRNNGRFRFEFTESTFKAEAFLEI